MEEGNKRWNQNSVAGKELKQFILDNGIHKLKPGDKNRPQPIDIWSSKPLYQQYKKENFRTNYNRLVDKLREELIAGDKMKDLNGGLSGK